MSHPTNMLDTSPAGLEGHLPASHQVVRQLLSRHCGWLQTEAAAGPLPRISSRTTSESLDVNAIPFGRDEADSQAGSCLGIRPKKRACLCLYNPAAVSCRHCEAFLTGSQE